MFLPIRTDSPLRTTPYVNWALIAANVLVFVAQSVWPNWELAYYLYPVHPTLVQFFTYQFLHGGGWHLVGNMLFLFIFGNHVNDKMGQLGYLAFYLACGVMAGTAYTLTERHGAPTLGASGAIAGVTGAYLILFPRSHITVIWWFMLIGRFEVQSLWFVLFFFAQDIFFSAAGQDNVAHAAHIGGTIFGAAICFSLVVVHLLPRDQFDVWALIQRWNKRRQYRDLVSKGYNPFDYAADETTGRGRKAAPDPAAERVLELRAEVNEALAQKRSAEAAQLYVKLRAADPSQVLSRQNQTDVAAQLHHDGQYADAAAAYEALLATYPTVERREQIELVLGVLYARYVKRYDLARTHLKKVVDRLHGGRELDLAKAELAAVEAELAGGGGAG